VLLSTQYTIILQIKCLDSDTISPYSQSVTTEDEELLTVQEAAVRAGLGETAIRNAILRGRLPEVLRYGRKLIRASDLETYQRNAKPGRPKKERGESADE
jgi:hypothetical protein